MRAKSARTTGTRFADGAARVAMLLGAACAPPAASAPNLILISLDTLRADRLSCYGYVRATSPNLDKLAQQGAVFENVVAEAPWTLPSHVSLLTGLFPTTHGVNLPSSRLGGDVTTLAQVLTQGGYATIGLTEGGYLARDYGLNRGFDIYSENRTDLAATLASARDILPQAHGKKPFFLFLHTYDIHCPYDPPPEHIAPFRTGNEDPIETAGTCGVDFNAIELTAGQVRTLSNRYDAGIHAADALLGVFFDELEANGVFEDTFVIVTSDHGEELYEHGRIGHERSVHRETLRVPWIVRGPGVEPRRLPAQTGLTDIAPTLIELVGLDIPAEMEGRSRAGWLLGREPAPVVSEPRFSQLSWKVKLQSVMTPTHQLIIDRESGVATLVEFPDTTHETLLESDSFLERELRDALDAHLSRARVRAAEAVEGLDPEQLERLRALGYGDE